MEVLTETINCENLVIKELTAEPLAVANETKIAPVYDFHEEVQKDWRAEKRLLFAEILVILIIVAVIAIRHFILLKFK